MPAKHTPEVPKIYTLGYIYTELVLEADPSFLFLYQGRDIIIHHEHMNAGDMSLVPGFFDTKWEYRSTARVIAPVFRYAGRIEDLLACVDIIFPIKEEIGTADAVCWATPKGYPYPYKNPA